MFGKPICAEITMPGDAVRTWLWLGPWTGSRDAVARVELRRVNQPHGVDPDEWSNPDTDPQVVERELFSDVEAAIAALEERGIDTDAFDAVWKPGNPF